MLRKVTSGYWSEQSLRGFVFDEAIIQTARDVLAITDPIRPIDWAPGYAVSAGGHVLTCRPCTRELHLPVRIMKPLVNVKTGHLSVRFQVGKAVKAALPHRLVAVAFLPPPDREGLVVRHLDGNPANNHVSNLAWGTQADNMADCIRHGRTLKGIKNPNAKLTPRRVEIAKALSAEGIGNHAIAKLFGVSPETVRRAVVGESWGDSAAG